MINAKLSNHLPPRVEDEVVVAEFSTLKEAELHMDKIKEERPNAYPHHRIETTSREDSGVESFV